MRKRASRHLLGGHLPAGAGFVALTAAFFWPVLAQFTTKVLSAGGDGSTFIWSYWYMPRAVLQLENPFFTTHLFHPVGANLAVHTTTPLEMALSWPIAQLFGFGVAVNLLQLSAVLLSALAVYLLALHLAADRRAAFFAGVAFAFVPYRFVHLGGHFNLIHTQFLPFGVLAFLRLVERPSRRRAVVLGALVGATFLTDFYYTVFLLLALAVIAVVRRSEALAQAMRGHLLLAAAVAALVAAPLAVPMALAVLAGELGQLPGWGGADVFSADLVSWFLPAADHPWWGSAFARARGGLSAGGEGLAYPGLVVMALALLGRELRDHRTSRRGWVSLFGVTALLSLGPFLQVGGASGSAFSYLGRHFTLPLPYMALHFIPVLNSVRVPGRFAIVAILALDVLAALALAAFARRSPRWAWAAFGAALALTIVEFLPGRLPMHPVQAPSPYERIAADAGLGAVLEIPLQWQSGTAVIGGGTPKRDHTIFVYYAVVHGKPLVSGYVARYPVERLRRLAAIPLYRQVLALGDEPGFHDGATFRPEDLRRLGIGYVVYHRDRPQPRAFDYVSNLGLEVLADDGTVIAWKV